MRGKRFFLAVGGAICVIGAAAFILFSSAGGVYEMSGPQVTAIESVPDHWWNELGTKRIFFAHRSVGENIIDGLRDITASHPTIEWDIVETTDFESVEGPVFFHSKVGKNTRPETKVEDFKTIMNSERGAHVDIAFVKFCYVDVRRDANPRAIFDLYQTAIADLQAQYPDVVFVHVTVPIESAPVGAKKVLKGKIKALLGRPGVVDDNHMRERYNELLRERYADKEPIFDLALCESISPEGRMSYHMRGSDKVCMMDSQYTDDGGHLNEEGRRVAAEQLLIALAGAVSSGGQP